MATDNKSPSYLRDREAVRRWLKTTPDGRVAEKILRDDFPNADASKILDDDKFFDWEELVREYRGAAVLAASCAEARGAFETARQARSTLGPPMAGHASWLPFMSTPLAYVLRRQIETADPDYWNDPVNVYREALEHPEWCRVSPDYVRGRLESYLPKGTKLRLAVDNSTHSSTSAEETT